MSSTPSLVTTLLVALGLGVPLQESLGPWTPVGGGAPVQRGVLATVERRLAAMGTWLALTVHAADRDQALAASEAAAQAIEACEKRLSTWSEDSELARLNRAPVGTEVLLSNELASDLARAQHFWLATEGAFDPGLGALVEAWGLRTGGHSPSELERTAALAGGGFAGIGLDGPRAVRRHTAALVEEGGFGKGLGLDAAVKTLVEAGVTEAVIDLGGQIAVLGAPCTTALAAPDERERAVLELVLDGGSLATSGNSERGILVDGKPRGHLLDPKTGAPVEDFGSLSVWAPDATAADCLSTGLYVMGPERAFAWRAAHRSTEPIELVVLFRGEGCLRACASEGLRGRLRALVPELTLAFVSEGSPNPPESLRIQR